MSWLKQARDLARIWKQRRQAILEAIDMGWIGLMEDWAGLSTTLANLAACSLYSFAASLDTLEDTFIW